MELFLNILWLLIALGALSLWCIDWMYQGRRAPSKLLQESIALACALIFAFFAVSLSDDLHATANLSDDCALGRRQALVWDCGHSSQQNAERPHVSPAVAPSRLLFSANLQVAERILPFADHVDHSLKERSLSGRSPPLPFHS